MARNASSFPAPSAVILLGQRRRWCSISSGRRGYRRRLCRRCSCLDNRCVSRCVLPRLKAPSICGTIFFPTLEGYPKDQLTSLSSVPCFCTYSPVFPLFPTSISIKQVYSNRYSEMWAWEFMQSRSISVVLAHGVQAPPLPPLLPPTSGPRARPPRLPPPQLLLPVKELQQVCPPILPLN